MNLSWQKKVYESCDHKHWRKLGIKLNECLDTSIKQEGLVDNYYLPLFFYLYEQTTLANQTTLIVGINAPQGGGKSTLTNYLVQLFTWSKLKAVTLSIDDFYLTREAQVRLAQDHSENIFLQQRGYPGTHDIDLGVQILSHLKNPQTGQSISLPIYDKSRHEGQGDRIDKGHWPEVQLPVDIVLLEGWMLGFQPLPQDQVQDMQLSKINSLLENYKKWHRFLDSFIYIYPKDPYFVVDWRCEAEERMKAQGLPGMSTIDVRNYAEKFLPAYHLYSPNLIEDPPVTNTYLKIEIGKDRLPTS